MINLFYGGSEGDSLAYLFKQAAQWLDKGGKALVIVPDQYTLETEKKAFEVLKTEGLMDLQIMSFSRMAAKLVGGSGLAQRYLDDLGRTMLLRKVINAQRGKLGVFAPSAGRLEFVRLMGSMIQEFKEFETPPQRLRELVEDHGEAFSDRMLMKKLADAAVIYEAYEEELQGKYLDTEDQLTALCHAIEDSGAFDGWAIYLAGFDFYSKRLISVLETLAGRAASLNVALAYQPPGNPSYNLFAPVEATIGEFRRMAGQRGVGCSLSEMDEGSRRDRRQALTWCSENLYSFPCRAYEGEPEGIQLLSCRDRETENEWAAGEIQRLVREEGLRFQDIAVAVGDLEARSASLQRLFRRYGIRFFDGRKSMAAANKYMQFLLGVCDLSSFRKRSEAFLRILSTGVLPVTREEAERLENYLYCYGSEGWRWEQDFTRLDRTRLTVQEAEEELQQLNRIRQVLMSFRERLEERLGNCATGRAFSEAFFAFLQEDVGLGDQIQEDADRRKEAGDLEYAAVTVQLWNRITAMLGQLAEVLGDSPCQREEFTELLRTGVETLEISLIPTTIDQVLVTDVKRAGLEGVRALFLLGVNEGVIPRRGGEQGILSDREKETLNGLAGEVCLSARQRPEREKLEIWRAISLAQEHLYVSYVREGDGEAAVPSPLAERLRRIFPEMPLREVDPPEDGALPRPLRLLRPEDLADLPELARETLFAQRGEEWENRPQRITEEQFRELYGEEIRMSPTSLENYAHCPFAYFLRYGIRAEERPVFELSRSEMGTLFHDVLMKFSREMSERNRWSVADEELCRKVVTEFADKAAADFRQGQLTEGPEGAYRISRIRSVCEQTAVMVSQHINRGQFHTFYFEMGFGRGESIPPLTLQTEDGRQVYIEGRIDRIDIAKTPSGALLKVIDYKSGSDQVVEEEIRKGYKMQLMMYMLAAREGMEKRYRQLGPAGVFYFHIQEPSVKFEEKDMENPSKMADKMGKEHRKAFRMDGVLVNEPEVIDALDEEFSGYSDIIRVRKLKDGSVKGNGAFNALDRPAFEQLLSDAKGQAERFAGKFTAGDVSVRPMRMQTGAHACQYCPYGSVCGFDLGIPGFRYR